MEPKHNQTKPEGPPLLIGTIESAIAVGRTLADSDARGVGEGFTF